MNLDDGRIFQPDIKNAFSFSDPKDLCLEMGHIPFIKHLRYQLIKAFVEFDSTRFSLSVRPHCEAIKQVTWGFIRMQTLSDFVTPQP